MSHDYTLSETGYDLIKSFEGFRPVDRTLINGQRVVGYGHKVRSDASMIVSRAEAQDLLKADLGPYEDMINNEVYAPLSQNQFDALVSLAFSIGPRAFQNSPTLHLMNNGRPLDAARSIEVWRKSRINGRTYIVDALVRRRAAEKALFLTPETGHVAAPRNDLESIEDTRLVGDIMAGDLPLFKGENIGMVKSVPYEQPELETDEIYDPESERATALATPQRRREDGPAGILTLSEVIDEDDIFTDEDGVFEIKDLVEDAPLFEKPSPIAVAAAEVSDRLDALMDSPAELTETTDWPESLITSDRRETLGTDLDLEDSIAERDDAIIKAELASLQESYEAQALAEAEIEAADIDTIEPDIPVKPNIPANDYTASPQMDMDASERGEGLGPYLVMMVIGLTFIGASLGAMMRGGNTQLGETMPFWAGVGIIVGAFVLLAALYYVLKSILRRG